MSLDAQGRPAPVGAGPLHCARARLRPIAAASALRVIDATRRVASRIPGQAGLARPPRRPPLRHLRAFTMGGRVPIIYGYSDDTVAAPVGYDSRRIDEVCALIAAGATGVYGGVDEWLHEALARHPVHGQRVAVMGSADQGFGPWYECVCLHHGGRPTAVDYNPIRFEDDRIEFLQAPPRSEFEPFDAALSISSFEHDGLGRYGDPIDPDADLKAMRAMKSVVRAGGLLYLAAPLGADKVVFNAHRIYGRRRLPMLLAGWTLIDSFGFDEALLVRDTGHGWMPRTNVQTASGSVEELLHPGYPEYSPVLVLRNE